MDENLCPICASVMKIRTNHNTQELFLGCSKYPKCKGTRPVDKNEYKNVPLPWDTPLSNERQWWNKD